jgi:methyl-accepting chemotaxis protein
MFSNFKIAQKIYIMGFVLLVFQLITATTSYTKMSKIGAELVEIAEADIPLSKAVTAITEHQLQQTILFERTMFHAILAANEIPGIKHDVPHLISEIQALSKKITKEISDTEAFVKKAQTYVHSEKAAKKFIHIDEELLDIEHLYNTLMTKMNEVLELAHSGQVSEMASSALEVEELEQSLEHKTVALLDEIQQFTLEASLQAEHDEQEAIVQIVIIAIIAVIVGLILPFIISRAIVKPINRLVSRLAEVASGDGDLTASLDDSAKDETGDVARAFNQFLGVLRKLISDTNQHADALGDSSETALSVMRETTTNVEKQRTETEMVATAVTEMHASTQEVATNATHASEVTELVKTRVNDGQKSAKETQEIIKRLADEVTQAGEVIKNLVEETNNIGSVLESIQGIAAQTNLLALNAAIEAARAGETGRGFAVVADEVRSLAQRTQTSTVDIQDLLERLQSQANNAVESMQKGSESAELCLVKSNETSSTFDDASAAVAEIAGLNFQIATAAAEQSAVAEEVNKNLISISHLAEVTADGAKTTESANQNIAKGVIGLHSNLNRFVV